MRGILITVALGVGLGLIGPAAEAGGDKAKVVTKTVEGKVQALDVQKGMLKVKKGQDAVVTVRLTPQTKILVEGKAGTLDQFRKGDVVVVTYEVRQEGNVARMLALNPPR